MNVNEVTVGLRYRVSGDLSNGCHADGTPRISHDDVVRVIKRITDTHVIFFVAISYIFKLLFKLCFDCHTANIKLYFE